MRAKAIRDLAQLPDGKLFEQIAEGLTRLVQNAQEFYADSERIAARPRGPSSRVLRAIAEEEAAKFLILVDAVRCPREAADEFSRQLGQYYDHLARGIYAEVANGQPLTFGDLRKLVDDERKDLFLDGPEGDDYIYRNRILEHRESTMYVDYEEYDGEHSWPAPRHKDTGLALSLKGIVPPPLETALALQKAGLASSRGLALIASIWRPLVLTDAFTQSELRELNRATCEAADNHSISGIRHREVIDGIVHYWQYPIHSLDLRPIKVSLAELRERRGASWLAEFNDDVF